MRLVAVLRLKRKVFPRACCNWINEAFWSSSRLLELKLLLAGLR